MNTQQEPALQQDYVIRWARIADNKFPKNQWLLIVTADEAHHIAYYDGKQWVANSKFGKEPIWWAELPPSPCA